MARYFFRLDDIAPNMNWENFNRIVEVFKRHDIKPLLAVIPDNQDPGLLKYSFSPHFWQIINQLSRSDWVVGQHGYQHLSGGDGGILRIHKSGEFGGLDFNLQKSMISSGKEIIETKLTNPDIFIAPRHSFDHKTVEALRQNDFKFISDGIGLFPFKKWGLVWLPQILWRPRKGMFGLVTVALHPNTMNVEEINILEKFIKINRGKIGDFDELIRWYTNSGFFKKNITFLINCLFKLFWWPVFWTKFRISK
jgi:predicted deacetylase